MENSICKYQKILTELLFMFGCFASFMFFTVTPPLTYICIMFMAIGLISGLVYRESIQSTFFKVAVFLPIIWLVILLSLLVAKTVKHYVPI